MKNEISTGMTPAQVQAYECRKHMVLTCLSMPDDLAENYAQANKLGSLQELKREDKLRRALGQGW